MLNKLSVAITAALLASCAAQKPPQITETKVETTPLIVESAPKKTATAEQVADALWQGTETEREPEAYHNLWNRIIGQFSFAVPNNQADIEQQKQFYLRNQRVLKTATENAAPFLYHLVAELERRNMPLELALLPIVESTYNPKAGNNSGVLGIWQFSARTGRSFGLVQNAQYDGRRDVIESSRAALDYLQYLYSNVDKDWLNAIAAFNAGEGRVFRAIAQNKKKGKSTDFWSLDLPKETTRYIPKLLAITELLQNASTYALSVPTLHNRPATRVISVHRALDLKQTAQALGMSLSEFQRLNPGFKSTIAAKGRYQLVLPLESPSDATERIAALPAVNTSELVKHLSGGAYKVRSGDTLSKIAAHHKTSVRALQQANNLSSTQLSVGQTLAIPTGNSQPKQVASAKANTKALTSSESSYTVKPGDSLWSIAKKLDVTTKDLMKWNKLSENQALKIGQPLTLHKKQAENERKTTYQVKVGDTLSTIAQRFQIKVAEIVKWNDLKTDNLLKPGQELTLYTAG